MKTEIFDKFNNRSIAIDHSTATLIISGDCSSSSITAYWIVNRFNPDCPYAIFITRERALDHCAYLNKKHSTDTFTVISRTIFV